MDAVASLGGTPVLADEWQIDLLLGGSQKVLSAPPGMSFVAISPRAWEIIAEVDYPGYDALKPFKEGLQTGYFPYTPYWQGLAALHTATDLLLKEGLQQSFARHEVVASACRSRVQTLGLDLYPAEEAVNSPTVTAVKVPDGVRWDELDRQFRQHGLVVGGSYGPLAGKVFRLGHMGSQADHQLVHRALDVVETVLSSG